MIGCLNEELLVRPDPRMGEICDSTTIPVETSYPPYPPLGFFPKYSGSRGSLCAFIKLASTAPATRSAPKDETWNCAHILRSEVAELCAVLKSLAGALIPRFASVSAEAYCALPSFSTWRR